MMEQMMLWLTLLTGVYFTCFAIAMKTHNFVSHIVFNVIPGLVGILWLFKGLSEIGWI